MLSALDELTRECLAIRVGRRLRSADVIDVLSDLCIVRRVPGHVVRARNAIAVADSERGAEVRYIREVDTFGS